MVSPSKKGLLFDLLRVFYLFFLFPYLLYQASLKDFGSPDFIFSSTGLFLIFLFSVLVAVGSLIDLKKSLEEKSLCTATFDLLFFLVFATISSLALSCFVKEVVSHIFSKVY
jgi:hypothetical protein